MNPPEPTITIQQLKSILEKDRNEVLLIDVRSKEEFETQHIPGAVNVPSNGIMEFANDASERDKTIVTICNHGGNRSQSAAQTLRDSGLKSSYLEGGTAGWYDEGASIPSIH